MPRPGALDWHARRACTEADAELFFPGRYDPSGKAKALCRICPVREDCLRYSLESTRAEHGIWGGFGDRTRRVIAVQYREGRLLADVIAADDERFYAPKDEATARREAAYQRKLARERRQRRERREAQAVAA